MQNNVFLYIVFINLFTSLFILFVNYKWSGITYLNLVCIPIYFYSVYLAYIQLVSIVSSEAIINIKLFDAFQFLTVDFSCEFNLNKFSSFMIFVVLCISCLVFIFSLWYMHGDPNKIKFFNYLNFFTFFMLLLITSSSFIFIFVGWEGIGIFSYLLINFWNTKLNANRSALSAVFINKLGDIAFYTFIGLFFVLFKFYTTEAAALCKKLNFDDKSIAILLNLTFAELAFSFIFIACVAKSAQFFLHVWLPNAMEGPTPVSALLHAATMVTAGAYIIIKNNWLIHFNENVLFFICLTGILTNILSSFVAIFQYDLKKIIAYSTASQIGLIFIAIGSNKNIMAFFHLYNHAFFKALLFILAGICIHLLRNKQDLRNFSEIVVEKKFLFSAFLLSSLTLAGFPFLSSYYSKEFILQSVFFNLHINSYNVNMFIHISILTTILYTLKILYYIFDCQISRITLYKKNKFKIEENNHFLNINFLTKFICYSLCVLSCIIGYVSFNYFFLDVIFLNTDSLNLDFEKNKELIQYEHISSIFILCFMFISFFSFTKSVKNINKNNFIYTFINKISNFFCKKTLIDNIVYYFIKKFLFIRNFMIIQQEDINNASFVFFFKNKKNIAVRIFKLTISYWWMLLGHIFLATLNILSIVYFPSIVIFPLVVISSTYIIWVFSKIFYYKLKLKLKKKLNEIAEK